MRLHRINEDLIPGGLGDDVSIGKAIDKFGLLRIWKGTKVEFEHTDDIRIAFEIAIDHLVEDADYYEKLELVHNESVAPAAGTGGTRSMPYKVWPDDADIDSEKNNDKNMGIDDLKDYFQPILKEPDDWVKPRDKKGPGS